MTNGFVSLGQFIPDVLLDMRYYGTYNFVGTRIDGYESPCALLTWEAAAALAQVSVDALALGFRLRLYDAYRPRRAVAHFARWAEDLSDTRMKPYFYPDVDKADLFRLGFIARRSGHSRGSTVDLTLFDMAAGRDLDMGGAFDFFGPRSHPDYPALSPAQRANRDLLRRLMVRRGFCPLSTEWWHFTLENEPYPATYFDFPVNCTNGETAP